MSRTKIAYDFCPMPRRWHAIWASPSIARRGLRDALFELNDGEPILFEGDWLESLCKQMHIPGRDRPSVRKMLLDLQTRGAVWVTNGLVSICFRPDAQLRPHVADLSSIGSASVVDLSSTGRGSDIPLESSVENHSTHDLQTDRQTDKKDRGERGRASARERAPLPAPPADVAPADPPLIQVIISEHTKRYIHLRAGEMPKADFRAAREIAEWCEANAAAHKRTADKLAESLIVALYANERAASRLWPLAWVAKAPQEFAPQPQGVLKPLTGSQRRENDKAERLKASREHWNQQIEKAREEGDEYTTNKLQAERDLHLTRLSSWLDQKEAS